MISCAGNLVALSQTCLEAVCSDLTRVDKFLVASPKERRISLSCHAGLHLRHTHHHLERVLMEQELGSEQQLGGSLARVRTACLQKITVNPFLPIPLCLSNIDFSHHIQMMFRLLKT